MPLPCGVLYAFLLFVQVFSPPAASPNLRRKVLHSYVTRSQRLRQSASRWGCFFCSFLVLQYIFLLIFNASFVYFSTIFFRLFFLIFFCAFVMYPLFWCVHYGETGSSPAGSGDCGGDDNCVVETKAARLSLKGSLSHLGKKKQRVQMNFQVYTFIENIFRTQSSFLGL